MMKPPLGSQLDFGDPINQGLVGCWLMNENGGTLVKDLSGNSYTGTIINAVWSPGKFGFCLFFDGTTDYVELTRRISAIGPGLAYTVSVWFRTTGATSRFLMSQVGGSSDRFEVHFDTSGLLNVGHYTGASYDAYKTLAAVSTSVWHHIAIVVSADKTKTIYLDGVNSTQAGTGSNPGSTATNFILGSTIAGANAFPGLIDVLYVYSRALTAAEVQRLYAQPFAGFRRNRLSLLIGALGGGAPPAGLSIPVAMHYHRMRRAS